MEYIHQGVVKIIALDYRNSFFLHNFIVLFLHSTVYIRGPKPSFPVLLPGWLSFLFTGTNASSGTSLLVFVDYKK